MGRRDNPTRRGIGYTLNWAWAWPANRRSLRPRVLRPQRQAVRPERKLIAWNGKTWGGADVPDFKVDETAGRTA